MKLLKIFLNKTILFAPYTIYSAGTTCKIQNLLQVCVIRNIINAVADKCIMDSSWRVCERSEPCIYTILSGNKKKNSQLLCIMNGELMFGCINLSSCLTVISFISSILFKIQYLDTLYIHTLYIFKLHLLEQSTFTYYTGKIKVQAISRKKL